MKTTSSIILSLAVPLATALSLFSSFSHSASNQNQDLYNQIKQADKTLFDAFNKCDVDTMAGMFSKDLEFYHDTAGLGGYEKTMTSTINNCNNNLGLVRTLIPETLVVYPVKDFGAIQLGEHTFCHDNNGKQDCGTFGFTHVWKQTDNGWLVHRVMSYGH